LREVNDFLRPNGKFDGIFKFSGKIEQGDHALHSSCILQAVEMDRISRLNIFDLRLDDFDLAPV
jgi:hypothetical protein